MSRQVTEMANKSLRDLQALSNNADPVQRVRLLCLSRGDTGILEMGRVFRRMDDDGNRHLNVNGFCKGLKKGGLDITDDEAKYLFKEFDLHKSGSINMDEFLSAIRPPMSASRLESIDKAFQKMDKTGDGVITIDDLKHVYNVKLHPQYRSGERSEESILKKFVEHFETGSSADGTVTKEEFLNYYSAISASVEADSDCYFDLMLRQEFKL